MTRTTQPTTPGPGWQPRWEPRWEPLSAASLALAADYERRTELFAGWREALVARLAPRQGDTVLDVGCGPGLNLGALRDAVGPYGTIIAVEESPELLAVAAHRVARRGWDNVELINAPVETATLSVSADGALFAAAPTVLASAPAVSNIVAQLRPGATVVAGGWTLPSPWLWPLRAAVTALGGPFVDESTRVERPWRLLHTHAHDLHVTQSWLRTGYLAHGHTPTHTDTDTDTDTDDSGGTATAPVVVISTSGWVAGSASLGAANG